MNIPVQKHLILETCPYTSWSELKLQTKKEERERENLFLTQYCLGTSEWPRTVDLFLKCGKVWYAECSPQFFKGIVGKSVLGRAESNMTTFKLCLLLDRMELLKDGVQFQCF